MKRPPFLGLWNIIRFNWPLFAFALITLIFSILASLIFTVPWSVFALLAAFSIFSALVLSLSVSTFIYDLSGIYQLPWLPKLPQNSKILNVTAGFDESTTTLRSHYGDHLVTACDFYHSARHPEPSIERARRLYPPAPDLLLIPDGELPFPDHTFSLIHAMFSLHEIRDHQERSDFLSELRRTLHPEGQLLLIEHLRDLPNLAAYQTGAWHFHPASQWHQNFQAAGLKLQKTSKHTPFITIYTLTK